MCWFDVCPVEGFFTTTTQQRQNNKHNKHRTNTNKQTKQIKGIAEGGGHVHVMYVYRDPRGAEAYDDSIGLSFKLPVREVD